MHVLEREREQELDKKMKSIDCVVDSMPSAYEYTILFRRIRELVSSQIFILIFSSVCYRALSERLYHRHHRSRRRHRFHTPYGDHNSLLPCILPANKN